MSTTAGASTTRRPRIAAWLLWVPTILAAAGVAGLEGFRAKSPTHPLFATPFAYSFAEAIERDDAQRAYSFIRAGQDPNGLITVRHAEWTGGREVLVPPLMWAVAARANHAAWMLLGFGSPGADDARRAECLATDLGNAEVADAIRQYGPPHASGTCRPLSAGETPLLAALEESGRR